MIENKKKSFGKAVSSELLLQNGVSSVSNGLVTYMDGADSFKITEISGTATSFTLVFEVSNSQNGTYTAIQGVRLNDYAMGTQSNNFGELWQFDGLAGLWFRVRISAISGGIVNVKGKVIS